MAGDRCVSSRLDGGVWLVGLTCPSRLNALGTGVLEEVARLVREPPGDAKAILLYGDGKVFSAGVDLSEVAVAESVEDAVRPFKALAGTMLAMLESSLPVFVLLEAPAIGGGAELALAADVILAARGARLSWPEVFWGLAPPLLSSLLGRYPLPAFTWAALGGELSAEDIVRLGLGVPVDDRASAVESVERLSSRWVGVEAVSKAIGWGRRAKRESLESFTGELYGLVDMGLVERARAFLSRRKG